MLEQGGGGLGFSVRSASAAALWKIGDASAVEPLTILLNNDRAAADAAWILGKIGDARAIEPLIASLSRIPVIAAEAIGKIGDARAIYPLTDYLKNDKNDRKAREAVLEALRKIRDPRAIKPLLNLTADRYWSEKVIELFGEILEHNATDTPLDSLSAIINLNRVMKADYKWVESTWGELPPGQDGHLEEIAPVQVDCSKIKFLAQQEMSRRKLTT
jgi:HEAT repeat protein